MIDALGLFDYLSGRFAVYPHLHFGLLNKPDPIAGRSLPFVFDGFTLDGAVDFDTSKGDRLVIRSDARQVRSAYPLYGGIQDYP